MCAQQGRLEGLSTNAQPYPQPNFERFHTMKLAQQQDHHTGSFNSKLGTSGHIGSPVAEDPSTRLDRSQQAAASHSIALELSRTRRKDGTPEQQQADAKVSAEARQFSCRESNGTPKW